MYAEPFRKMVLHDSANRLAESHRMPVTADSGESFEGRAAWKGFSHKEADPLIPVQFD